MPEGASKDEECCWTICASSLVTAVSMLSSCWERKQAGAVIRWYARGDHRCMEKRSSGFCTGSGKQRSAGIGWGGLLEEVGLAGA
jgi:hypothetical protein